MQPLWLVIENTIRRKVVASPKSGPWWILWVRVCLWFVHAPKVFQLCTNQLVVWFVQGCMNNWPHYHLSLSPSWNSNTPKMLWTKKRTPTPFSFIIVIFELAFESFKEFGGASLYIWTKFFCLLHSNFAKHSASCCAFNTLKKGLMSGGASNSIYNGKIYWILNNFFTKIHLNQN